MISLCLALIQILLSWLSVTTSSTESPYNDGADVWYYPVAPIALVVEVLHMVFSISVFFKLCYSPRSRFHHDHITWVVQQPRGRGPNPNPSLPAISIALPLQLERSASNVSQPSAV